MKQHRSGAVRPLLQSWKGRILPLLAALLLLLSACVSTPAAGPEGSAHPPSAALPENSPAAQTPPAEGAPETLPEADAPAETDTEGELPEDGTYTSKEDVALYLHLYGCLPSNFITKKEAQALGWTAGSLEPYAPGKCIGGSYFGNYEGLLPEASGRTYAECDIDTLGASSRGAKRIVYSNDGLIYYTGDHYESFELLYGEP